MATALVHIALIAYTAGAAVYLVWLLRPRERFVAAGRILLAGGLVLHLGSFAAAYGGGSEGLFEWRGGQLFSLL
ncbi:MAG TPA: cytochrome C biogenesis protein, partial [Myxococcales bacterium]|nr:cytochrome C biogenesis protein [Myxococcales bacterium]